MSNGPLNNPSSPVADQVKVQIAALSKRLSSLGESDGLGNGISPVSLAERLFSRAAQSFFETRSTEDLVEITKAAKQVLNKLHSQSSAEALIVSSNRHTNHTAVYVALKDRPFIVNTLRASLGRMNLLPAVHLHPILQLKDKSLSLSYIEIGPITVEELKILEERLTEAMRHLISITDQISPMLNLVQSSAQTTSEEESKAFLTWLCDQNIVFLGAGLFQGDSANNFRAAQEGLFGILSTESPRLKDLISEVQSDLTALVSEKAKLRVTKLRALSPVHKDQHLVNFLVPIGQPPEQTRVLCIIGLFTSKGAGAEAKEVPVVRNKLAEIIKISGVVDNSHDYKHIVDLIDVLPKSELLRLPVSSLLEVVEGALVLENLDQAKLYVFYDDLKRGASCFVLLPRDRVTPQIRDQVQALLEEAFSARSNSAECHFDSGSREIALMHFFVPLPDGILPTIYLHKLEQKISQASKTFADLLREAIFSSEAFNDPSAIWRKYSDAFPPEYHALHSVAECEQDISLIETLSASDPLQLSFSLTGPGSGGFTLILYSLDRQMTISTALPVLENIGLEVVSEKTSCITPLSSRPVFVHRFLVKPKVECNLTEKIFKDYFGPGIKEVFLGQSENDTLNSLILTSELPVRAVRLIRTYCAFLWQLGIFPSRRIIFETISGSPELARRLWEMFDLRFNPKLSKSIEIRQSELNDALAKFRDELRSVSDITRDRVLRALAELLEHTQRTNFYTDTQAIALKFRSDAIGSIPQPRPKFEIFISSPRMEGVHLRSGSVARGGIRWSDRPEDYRSEILGLMKTQRIKNVVIVPTGAKGGFIVRRLPSDPQAVPGAVEDAYREFIRALLSLTDNRINDKIVRPANLIIYDPEDPYLVVAADKGTATFSDIANKIATDEFSFWLGDAFASGGSNGYDHKLYGITAKGAWECVERHFRDLAIDINTPFTAVGIGDMSGDVFGNGLLLSRSFKLVAAFNHKHIFIDPNPDPARSFEERTRLFGLARSQWSDYNPTLISPGGGVHLRVSKEIRLTPQARQALAIPSDVPEVVNGEQLINLILKANCDLLWNGGIGTYVKSSIESHADVRDGTNDAVRISAPELRAKMCAEGGNLGFTQAARIEYATRGGLINTDAIDNSAGVDLSDHEVNLKILFARLIADKKLTLEERNKLLKEMAPEVVEAVLEHNRSHALLLTRSSERSKRRLVYYTSLLRELVRLGYLSRSLDCLPDEEELADRADRDLSLYRPELAVCIAGLKMWITDLLTNSDYIRDPALSPALMEYFPKTLRHKFPKEIENHPLAVNIIATQLTNELVDAVGISLIHRLAVNQSTPPSQVVKCAVAAMILVNQVPVMRSLRSLDTFNLNKTYLEAVGELSRMVRDTTSWLITYRAYERPLNDVIQEYLPVFVRIRDDGEQLFSGQERDIHLGALAEYRGLGVDESCARTLALSSRIILILEMIRAAKKSETDISLVATTFSKVLEELGLGSILNREQVIETNSKWEYELLVGSYEDIRKSVAAITVGLLTRKLLAPAQIATALRAAPEFEQIKSIIQEFRERSPNPSALSIIARKLRSYYAG